MIATYLIPTIKTSDGLPMQYKVVERKKDMRTRFCRQNSDKIIDKVFLAYLIDKYSLRMKEDRIIIPYGSIAYSFRKEVR